MNEEYETPVEKAKRLAIFWQGVAARRENVKLEYCPYPKIDMRFDHWRAGWFAGAKP